MTWRERLLEASFKDVPFDVEEPESLTGRRVVVHTYWGSERRRIEDVGPAPRMLRLKTHLVGPDYDQRAVALEKACNSPGPGILVHPWYGPLECICHACIRRDPLRRGGKGEFDLHFEQAEFVLVEQAAPPVATIDEIDAEAEAAAADGLTSELKTSGPQQWRDAATGALKAGSGALSKLNVFDGLQRDVGAVTQAALDLSTRASELITAPADLVKSVFRSVRLLRSAYSGLTRSYAAYRQLYRVDFGDPLPGRGSLHSTARRNRALVRDTWRVAALIAASRDAAKLSWASLPEAQAARQELLADQAALSDTVPDGLLGPLGDLRAAISRGVPGTWDLPDVIHRDLPEALPATLLAWMLYRDGDRDLDLARRNRSADPNHLSGTLEVLSR